MINIKIYVSLSLVSFVACGGGLDPPIIDDEFRDTATTPIEDVQAYVEVESPTPVNSSEQEPGQSSYVSGNALGRPITLNIESKDSFQNINFGNQFFHRIPFGDNVESPTPATSTEQQPGQSSFVSGSGMESSTFYSTGNKGFQHNNTGTQSFESFSFGDDVESPTPAISTEQQPGQSSYVSASGMMATSTFYNSNNTGFQHINTGTQSFESFSFGDDEPPTPAISTEQQPGQSSFVSGSGMESSTYYSSGNTGIQHVNTGTSHFQNYTFGGQDNTHNTLNGSPIVFQGETLLIGGYEIVGVNAAVRPIVLTWGNYKLYVNGREQPKLGGIEGTGTWRFEY